MISELADLEYGERLRRCNLTTLEIRRHRADLLEVYRIVHGINDLDPGEFFIFRSDGEGRDTIVKFTQLCSKFPPTAPLNFALDWLALDRDISFGRLTSPNV